MKKYTKIALIIFVGLIVVIAAGNYGYDLYQQNQFIKAIIPHVKTSSLRTSNDLGYLTGTSNITMRETLKNLETDISEIDKKFLEVQTASTTATKVKADIILAYLKGCQELLRAQKAICLKVMEVNIATDQELNKVAQEYNNAKSELVANARKLIETRKTASAILPAEIIVDPDILSKVIDKFEKDAKPASQ